MAKKKTHGNIVKIVKLQGNAPKKWGGEWKKSAMASATPLATPLPIPNNGPEIF